MLDQLRAALQKRLERATTRLADLDAQALDVNGLRSAGNQSLQEGKFYQAEQAYRKILSAFPDDVKALVNVGFALKEQQRLIEARTFLKRAIALRAQDALPHEPMYLMGQIAEAQGQLDEAVQCFTSAFELKPDFEFACRDLCRVLFFIGKMAQAQTVLSRGLAAHPEYADFHFYQGNLHVENERPDLAAQSYTEALRLGARYADIYSALGAVQYKLGDAASAQENFRQAVAADASFESEAHYQAGCFGLRRGEYADAIQCFERAIALRADMTKAHSSLLFCLSFYPSGTPSYQQAAQRFGRLLTSQTSNIFRPPRLPYKVGQRPLRVGFVSGEFKMHPVGVFLEGILREIDPQRATLIAYSNTANVDENTTRLRRSFAQWHEIKGLPDDEVAKMVRDDRIDILVDLGGHTGDSRLPLFARQPAPVQVSWLGYFASTGVAEIDYILADPISVPENHTEFFSEKLCYLPDTRLCMMPPLTQRQIQVKPPPAATAGHITFGSYQARTKINDRVLAVWSRVLAAVPGSVLRLQIQHMHIPVLRDAFFEQMRLAGIDMARVSVSNGLPWEDYLDDYNQVDILLDTFPYPGGTTTAEALWMGVPTVTLLGDTMLSRQGASMLNCVGLHDWVATSEDDYVARAVGLASDVPALAALRATLRDRTLQSPLFDNRRFAHNLQNCFDGMFLSSR